MAHMPRARSLCRDWLSTETVWVGHMLLRIMITIDEPKTLATWRQSREYLVTLIGLVCQFQ